MTHQENDVSVGDEYPNCNCHKLDADKDEAYGSWSLLARASWPLVVVILVILGISALI